MILEIHNASINFGKTKILKNISFILKKGEITGIFGRNGSGKSTLLKMIFGTMKKGKIDMSINTIPFNPTENIVKKFIAYLPQISFLPRNLRIHDLILLYFDQEKDQDCIFYDPFIAGLTSKRVTELSLGQIRYLEVRLLTNLPHPILMLDEPFSMIEPLYVDGIKNILNDLKAKKAIIITDHYYKDIMEISTRNILIKEGKNYTIKNLEDLRQHGYLGNNYI